MHDAGRIGFVIKGEYSNLETYDFLDVVYYNHSSYVAKKETSGNPPVRNNEYWQMLAEGGGTGGGSDVSDTAVTFHESENRVNIETGETVSTLFGKIKKFFTDLKKVAFSGKYEDLEGIPSGTNDLLATVPGTWLDAVQGNNLKGLHDQNAEAISEVSRKIIALIGDVTGSVVIGNYVNNISVMRKGCYVGQDGDNKTKPYYRFASVNVATNTDANITFHVWMGYGDHSTKLGILTAHTRVNNFASSVGCELVWEVAVSGINVADFKIAYKPVDDNTTNFELWTIVNSGWTVAHFDVISEGGRTARLNNKWTLYSAITAGSEDAVTSGYTVQNSTLATIENPTTGAYPVGTVYTSLSSTKPGSKLGGTWEGMGTIQQAGTTCYMWKRTS